MSQGFYGTTLKKWNVGGFNLSERFYAPNTFLPPHAHTNPYFSINLSGSYLEKADTETIFGRHDVGFHPAQRMHCQQVHHSVHTAFAIELNDEWLKRWGHLLVNAHSLIRFPSGSIRSLMWKIYREFRIPDDVSAISIEGLTLELLSELKRTRSAVRSIRIQKVKEFVHDRFHERIQISEIAASIGLHPVHLCREFRKSTRMSIGEYIRSIRIDFACRNLATEKSLTEIASLAGFSDQSHFNRAFKKVMNTTPARFRLLHKRR